MAQGRFKGAEPLSTVFPGERMDWARIYGRRWICIRLRWTWASQRPPRGVGGER